MRTAVTINGAQREIGVIERVIRGHPVGVMAISVVDWAWSAPGLGLRGNAERMGQAMADGEAAVMAALRGRHV